MNPETEFSVQEALVNLVDMLRSKISGVEDGDHSLGLRATLGHIEVAFRHYERGRTDPDETAFNDVIYRTNQAFEGGIKEAYRILTGNDPGKKTPYKIEQYLETNEVFRERVLNQFKNYRTEWRNPSAHDYKLDFDDSEAFLAIISVSAFFCVLLDQIVERVAFNKSKAATRTPLNDYAVLPSASFYEQVSSLIQHFLSKEDSVLNNEIKLETTVIGSLHGMLASSLPDIDIYLEQNLSSDSMYRADIILKRGQDQLLIEIKRWSKRRDITGARYQVEKYLRVSGLSHGLLVFAPDKAEAISVVEYQSESTGSKIGIILPQSGIGNNGIEAMF